MKTRMMVCAFLTHGDEVLLIHRGLHKKIAPGFWSGIGGHMEPEEINDPHAACLREIEEEAGIRAEQIDFMALRYITIRSTGEEIRVVYWFIGATKEKPSLPECDEGSLHWVHKEDGLSLAMTDSVKLTYCHWHDHPQEDRIFLLGMDAANQQVSWIVL